MTVLHTCTDFFPGAVSYSNAWFGQGGGAILLDNINCVGIESDLLNCSHHGIGIISSFCTHQYDVGVECPFGEE